MSDECVVFSGTASPVLAGLISRELEVPLAMAEVERFPDGEVSVQLGASVRRKDVFLIQSTSPPVDQHLIELLAFVDACRRGDAGQVIAVMPYFGYSRSDKRVWRREPIMARVVAELLQVIGVDHLFTIDLHTPQIEGFFRIPVDGLTAVPVLCGVLAERLPRGTVVVAPDAGRVGLATAFANRLDSSVAVLHKRRESGSTTRITHVVGDVRDRPCLLVDDIIATAGTIRTSVDALLEAGARPEITVAATHGLLVGTAREQLAHPAIREVFLTDTVPVALDDRLPLRIVTVSRLLAGAIQRFLANSSLSELY